MLKRLMIGAVYSNCMRNGYWSGGSVRYGLIFLGLMVGLFIWFMASIPKPVEPVPLQPTYEQARAGDPGVVGGVSPSTRVDAIRP